MDPLPVYEFEIAFYRLLGIRHETRQAYRRLGFLRADAETSTRRPLFKIDPESIARHRAAIQVSPQYRSICHNPATGTKVFTPSRICLRWKRADQPTGGNL